MSKKNYSFNYPECEVFKNSNVKDLSKNKCGSLKKVNIDG